MKIFAMKFILNDSIYAPFPQDKKTAFESTTVKKKLLFAKKDLSRKLSFRTKQKQLFGGVLLKRCSEKINKFPAASFLKWNTEAGPFPGIS